MVNVDQVPGAIEGSKILVTGQKIVTNAPPKKCSKKGVVVFPISIEIRGNGTIIQENNPKKYNFRSYSNLDQYDKVLGKRLWGLSSDPIGIQNVGGHGRTSSHSGQELSITGLCLLEIVQGWRGQPLTEHPKTVLLQPF